VTNKPDLVKEKAQESRHKLTGSVVTKAVYLETEVEAPGFEAEAVKIAPRGKAVP